MTCQAFFGSGGMINGCADGPLIQSTNPAGTYAVHVQFRDRAGHVSNTAIAQFQIR